MVNVDYWLWRLQPSLTETPFRRAKSLPPTAEESMDQDCKGMSPPPPYSAPVVTSSAEMYIFSQEQQHPPLENQPPASENSSQTNQEPLSPKEITLGKNKFTL